MKRWPKKTKQAVLDALRAGQSPTEVAEQYQLDPRSVAKLRRRMLERTATPLSTPLATSPPSSAEFSSAAGSSTTTSASADEGQERNPKEPNYEKARKAASVDGPDADQEQELPPRPEFSAEGVVQVCEFAVGAATVAAASRYQLSDHPKLKDLSKLSPGERQILTLLAPAVAQRLPEAAALLDKWSLYIAGGVLCFITYCHCAAVKALARALYEEKQAKQGAGATGSTTPDGSSVS